MARIDRAAIEPGYRGLNASLREPPLSFGRRGSDPLVDPRLGQGFLAETQIEPQVDRLDAVVGRPEIELGAIALDFGLRSGHCELDRATRRGEDRLHSGALGNRCELTADEIDREAPREELALLPDITTQAVSRRHHPSDCGIERPVGAPKDAIRDEQLLPRLWLVEGIPKRHDVIGGLVPRRDLHELHGALAPALVA